jgi:mannose-1-phosphate guanylyltransferase/mannose-6-phosphate isomerase
MNNNKEIKLLSEKRPWGYYKILDYNEGYQIKKLVINPNGQLSLQSHNYRNEQWYVISGNPTVTKGETVLKLKPNDTIFIEIKEKHRIENFTNEDVVIIEIQTGEYLGEDDIIRYSDAYGRISKN